MDVFPSISRRIPELKLGDENAWNELCNTFRQGLTSKTRYLMRTSSAKVSFNVDDLVQETLLKAWKGHRTFQGKTTSQFASWILTILKNTFIDWCRSEKPECNVTTWFRFCGDSNTPSAEYISFEREAGLHACLSHLPEKHQQVLMLRHFEGLKFSEIAEQTATNINTVAGIYRRGLAELVELMTTYGFKSRTSNPKISE